MKLDATAVVARTSSSASLEAEGRAFVVTAASPDLVGLNEAGSAIWRWLEVPCSIAELADKLTEEFDIQREAALADCLEFVARLLDKQLLQLGDPAARVPD